MYFTISKLSLLLAGVLATCVNVNAAPIPSRHLVSRDASGPMARVSPRSNGAALASVAAKRNVAVRQCSSCGDDEGDDDDDLPPSLMSTSTSAFVDDPFCYLASNSKKRSDSLFAGHVNTGITKRAPKSNEKRSLKSRMSSEVDKRVVNSTASTTSGTGSGSSWGSGSNPVNVDTDGIGELVQFEFMDGSRVFSLVESLGQVLEGDGAIYSFIDAEAVSADINVCFGVVRVPIPTAVDATSQAARDAMIAGLDAFIQLDAAKAVIYAASTTSSSDTDNYYMLVPLSVISS